MLAFGAAMLVAVAGTAAMSAALGGVKSKMKAIATSAKEAESSLNSMQGAVNVVQSGLSMLGEMANTAMASITAAFNSTAMTAQAAGLQVGTGFTMGLTTSLVLAPPVARNAVNRVVATLRSGYGAAYSAGAYISEGFAAGMESCLARIEAAAERMVAAAEKAIRAKAMIASPSKLTKKLGGFYGEGFAIGISDMERDVAGAAKRLVSIPEVMTPNLSSAFGGEMAAEYDYYRNAEYTIVVTLPIDGKEFARTTATYTQAELDKRQARDSRKHGRV